MEGRHTVFSWKKRLAAQHLSKDTANTPYINSLCVFLECQHDLWSTVPACGDVFSHEAAVVIGGGCRAGEAEVADFQVAVGVEKEI